MSVELNREQEAVVESASRDLFVAAAAGSGKTRVITERFVRIALTGTAASRTPESVLTITFTEKAAEEIAERVRERLAGAARRDGSTFDVDRAWISTIHGMCARLLRRHALEAGIDPLFSVGSEVELRALRQEAFERAAKVQLAQGPSGTETLLDTVRTGDVFEGVAAAYELCHSLGTDVTDLRRSSPDAGALRGAADRLGEVRGELLAAPTTQTVEANAAALECMIAAIESALADPAAAPAAVAASQRFKQAKRGSEAVKRLALEAEEIVGVAGEQLAQAVVEELESAFVALVVAFAGEFDAAKAERSMLDFDDLQLRAAELLEAHPEIAASYAQGFVDVMVDEYQDTNALQMRVIRALTPEGLVSVGDEKQAIYGFRHADVGIFRMRAEVAQHAEPLTENYRTDPRLLELLNDVFASEPFWPEDYLGLRPARRRDGGYRSDLHGPDGVTALLVDARRCDSDAVDLEAAAVATHVRNLVDGGVGQGDVVILLRAMTLAERYADALRAQGLEPFVASGRTYFDRPEVVDLEMLLRTAANPLDCEALAHMLAGPMTGISDDGLARLRLAAGRQSLWSACQRQADVGLKSGDARRLAVTVDAIDEMRRDAGRRSLFELIHEACERLEYDLTLFAEGANGARAWANVLKLARIADTFDQVNPGDVGAFLEYLALRRDTSTSEGQAAFAVEGLDAVRIMSIHAAKGLEFPVVIVADLGRGRPTAPPIAVGRLSDGTPAVGLRLPAALAGGSRSVMTAGHRSLTDALRRQEQDEEKRIFYVACTRAEEALVLAGHADFDRPAGDCLAIDWVRRALGFEAAGSIVAGERAVGPSRVLVVTPDALDTPAGESCAKPVPPQVSARPVSPDETRAPRRDRHTKTASTFASAGAPVRLSYSGIARYADCPYAYYAERVARLGDARQPEMAEATPAGRGSAIHAALSMSTADAVSDRDRIAEICAANGLGRDAVDDVAAACERFIASPCARDLTGADRVQREAPFAIPVGPGVLEGALDLIAWRDADATVLDYKTGSARANERTADRRRLQAECYAFAAFALGARRVRVVFFEIDKSGEGDHYAFGPDDEPRIRTELESIARSIASGTFPSRPVSNACEECRAAHVLCGVAGGS